MSIHQPSDASLPIATSNLVPFPSGKTSAPLIEMAPEKAETIIRNACAAVFLSAPGTVTEIALLDHIELRLPKVEDGVDIEINDTETILQLWRKRYLKGKWAFRGLAAAIDDARLGLVLPTAPGRKRPSRKSIVAEAEAANGMGRDAGQPAIWKKRIEPQKWEASFGAGPGRVEALLVIDTDGADATLKWRGTRLRSSFDGEWEAKSATIKLAHELLGWQPATSDAQCVSPEG